jgi:hypothetical protein
MTLDWSKLTPAEDWAALKSAPKITSPWRGEGNWWYRAATDGQYVAFSEWEGFRVPPLREFVVGGRDCVDELLKRDGWILLEEEP